MIEKKAGDIRVGKLRTIVLFEPDFNFNNKKLGRDVMWKGEGWEYWHRSNTERGKERQRLIMILKTAHVRFV